MNSAASFDAPLPDATEQALQWLVELHSGEADEQGWERYRQWCESAPENSRAALIAERLWESLGGALERPRGWQRPRALLGFLLALGILGGAGWQAERDGWMADQRTTTGERRTVQLTDGSRLELAPGTRVDIDLDGSQRTLHLYAGELFVQVAPDARRPFEVEAGGGRMRALGTAFDVRNEAGKVRLVVTEHRVGVTLPTSPAPLTAQVGEGQAVDFDGSHLSAVRPVDADAVTAWRRDRLVFHERPLGEVLDELARYHHGVLWTRDERLRELRVTGTFETADVPAQLALLQRALPIRIRHLPWLTRVESDDSRRDP